MDLDAKKWAGATGATEVPGRTACTSCIKKIKTSQGMPTIRTYTYP